MILVVAVLVFLAVIATAIFLAGWFVVKIFWGTHRFLFGSPFKSPPRPLTTIAGDGVCARAACRAENPEQAVFCRRCGEPLATRSNVRSKKKEEKKKREESPESLCIYSWHAFSTRVSEPQTRVENPCHE